MLTCTTKDIRAPVFLVFGAKISKNKFQPNLQMAAYHAQDRTTTFSNG